MRLVADFCPSCFLRQAPANAPLGPNDVPDVRPCARCGGRLEVVLRHGTLTEEARGRLERIAAEVLKKGPGSVVVIAADDPSPARLLVEEIARTSCGCTLLRRLHPSAECLGCRARALLGFPRVDRAKLAAEIDAILARRRARGSKP